MFVAVTRFQIQQDRLDELKTHWDSMVQVARQQKGLKKDLLITSQHGRCLAIGFWDSIEDAKKWGDNPAYKNWLNQLNALLLGTPERDIYSVASGDLSGIFEAKKAA